MDQNRHALPGSFISQNVVMVDPNGSQGCYSQNVDNRRVRNGLSYNIQLLPS